jgi:hypothetical protein
MKEPYQLKHLFPFIDAALLSGNDSLEELFPKAIWLSGTLEKSKLQTAKILFVHPDGILEWRKRLIELHKEEPLHIEVCIIADSDYTMGHEHLDPLLECFPSTQFWVQNWFGYHDRVKFLPIGVNGPCLQQRERYKPLAISFFLNYPGFVHREKFSAFLESTPEVQQYCLPFAPYETYCELVSECRFSCCPMGGGYDTLRFWETLLVGTIPIVKKHPFYEVIKLYYPTLPMVIVDDWKDILELDLSEDLYEQHMTNANVDCLSLSYWTSQLQRGK